MALTNTKTNTTTYAGAVICVDCDRNVRVMSDVWDDQYYAVVWTGSKVDRVWTCYESGDRSEVDATPEVVAAAVAWIDDQNRLDSIAEAIANKVRSVERRLEYTYQHPAPRKGEIGEVFKGRKVPVGTKGKIFWIGEGNYGWRVGLDLGNGNKVFTALANVTTEQAKAECAALQAAKPGLQKELETLRADLKVVTDAATAHRDGSRVKRGYVLPEAKKVA